MSIFDFTKQIGKNLPLYDKITGLKEGDYKSLLNLARNLGFEGDLEELIEAAKGHDTNGVNTLGWRDDYYLEDPDQKLTAVTSWTTYKEMALLQGQLQKDCYDIVQEVARNNGVRIITGTLHHNRLNLSIEYPIHVSFGVLVETLKCQSSTALKAKHPHLEDTLNKMSVWSVESSQ